MPIHHKQLPPFGTLLAFEAVARLHSFTAAARELQVSQAAISQKVREFETWLNTDLVLRRRPHLEITRDGLRIADSIRSGVTTITRSLDAAKRTSGRRNRVALATTNSFALYWLGPRIGSFYTTHPEIELSLITADKEVTDSEIEFDIGVTFAERPPLGYSSKPLFHADVVAVASPRYLEARPANVEPAQWPDDMLLHLVHKSSLDWPEWLAAVDLPFRQELRADYYSTYITLVQAVLSGRGMALGWRQLINPILESGDLVQVGERAATSSAAYYLIWRAPANTTLPVPVAALRDWFLEAAER
jgi:DNA-binding transcriptional LysR family regulator